jgi:YVTN family beta-propeller protein
MLALYRSGRQADALDVYRRGRRQLQDGLGLEPGEELRRLEQAILTHDPAIACPGAPAPGPARDTSPARFSHGTLGLAVGAIVLAGAITGVLLSRSPHHPAVAAVVPAHSLAVVAAGTDRIGRIRLGWTPTRVALSGHTLWMLDARDETVVRLDLDTRRVVRTIGIGVTPTAVAVGDAAAWVLAADPNTLIRIDPAYDLVRTTRVPLGRSSDLSVGDSAGLAVSPNGVWIEDGASTLLRVAPGTGTVILRLRLGHGIDGVTVGAGSIWVTRGSPATLLRVDPQTGQVTARIPIAMTRGATAPYPIGVAFASGFVWVLNGNTGTVSRVDPALDAVTATVPRVSLNPIRIVAGMGAVWVADAADDAVERIDPATARVTRSVTVGGLPASLAAGPTRVWVAVDAS